MLKVVIAEIVIKLIWTVSFEFSVCDRYYFPTYENDNLLCQLEDSDEEKESRDIPGCVKVIAEDNKVLESILTDETLRQDILSNTWKSILIYSQINLSFCEQST